MKHLFFALVALILTSPAQAADVTYGNGKRISVNETVQEKYQQLFNWLEARGYKIEFARGYGTGTVRHSLHRSGMAVDINQTHRNRVTKRFPPGTTEYAASLGIFHGAKWSRHPDYGHFQVGGWQGQIAKRGSKTKVAHAQPKE